MKTILIEHNGLWAGRIASNLGEDFNLILASNEFTYDAIQKELNLPFLKDVSPDEKTRNKLIQIASDPE